MRSAADAGRSSAWVLPGVVLLVAVLLWSYWPVLRRLVNDWRNDDNYSVGALVPVAGLYLLWINRKRLGRCPIRPSLWGLPVILAAEAARWYGLTHLFESAERYAFVLTLWGLVWLVLGTAMFRRLFWILCFLLLMVPLPGKVHNLISNPLQTLASSGAVFMLELMGVAVIPEGNVMVVNGDTPLAVAEACSGLRMLTAFVVVAAVLAFVVHRPPWQRAVLVVSSVPVAIVCNMVRLAATAVLFLVAGNETAQTFFHDFAGLVMMPTAFAILMGELWIMARLEVHDEPAAPPRKIAK